MAQILYCSQQVYSNYELGQRDIPTKVLISLAKKYHQTTTDYLLGLTNYRGIPKEYTENPNKDRMGHRCICQEKRFYSMDQQAMQKPLFQGGRKVIESPQRTAGTFSTIQNLRLSVLTCFL